MTLLLVSAFAIVASCAALRAWVALGRLRRHRDRIDALRVREAFVADATRGFMEASRTSSDAVVAKLAATLRERAPSLDSFLVFSPAGEELACVYAEGARVEHYRDARFSRVDERRLPARAALAGHRLSGSEGCVVPTDGHGLAVPLLDERGLHAVVYVSSRDPAPAVEEETIVRAIENAASPFALARERERDRSDATYDGLTGLLTPRAFRERLRDEVTRLRRSSLISLWFIDTDHFKAVNDGYGHAAGDRVLQCMAKLLRAHAIDGMDVVARNGGDEFCALIFDAQKSAAIERAQGLCDAVRRCDFQIPLRITASIGVASYPDDAPDASELLERADAAMYHSKRLGRNRVSFATAGAGFSVYR